MTDKPDLTLYLGGTRSGKSARAEAAALQAQGPVLYVATAEARADDASMLDRIRRHRARRPAHWRTLECPCRLAESIAAALASDRLRACRPPHPTRREPLTPSIPLFFLIGRHSQRTACN